MMKYIFPTLLLLMCLTAQAQKSSELSDASYLRKLSLHIRGTKPAIEEYQELKALSGADEKAAFFKRKIDEYLSSTGHRDRMVVRLAERFEIITPKVSRSIYDRMSQSTKRRYFYYGQERDSLTELFAKIATDNLSWDTLLAGTEYRLFKSNPLSSDYKFFHPVYRELPDDLEPSDYQNGTSPSEFPGFDIKFSSDDPRIAGALTTPRFISRYNTTNTNRNRRRAAAVFRIFLCDSMAPVIPPPQDRKGDALDYAFAEESESSAQAFDHSTVTEKQLEKAMMSVSDAVRHGADPKCAACHYKLDPMGKTFQSIGTVLSPYPSSGALVFKRADGTMVNRRVKGLGDLARAIVQEPDYVSCQVEWFWNEFIGNDVTLYPDRKEELIDAFEKVGRRTNDFIRILVQQPEFRERPKTSEHIVYSQVRPLLRRCDSCHNGEGYIPSFSTKIPGQADLLEMRRRLNLPDHDREQMPQNKSLWRESELELLRRWLDGGARDDQGTPQLTEKGREVAR